MIKIKDDVDLDKLVGFHKGWDDTYWGGGKNCSIFIDKRKYMSLSTSDGLDNKALEKLYNLFKMGIIEEVRDVKD